MPYDAGQLQATVARRRRRLRSRVISLVITGAVLAVAYLSQIDTLQRAAFVGLYGVVLAVSLGWLAVAWFSYRGAGKELAGAGSGTAVRIGPPGIQVADCFAPWSEVLSVAAVKGGVGRSPVLRLTTTGGVRAQVAFDQIAAYPATLDGAVRAYSASRHGVDLAALES